MSLLPTRFKIVDKKRAIYTSIVDVEGFNQLKVGVRDRDLLLGCKTKGAFDVNTKRLSCSVN